MLSRSIEFNGETFELSEDINTAIDLPLTGLWLGAEAQGVSYQDNSLMEFNAQLGYESKLGFGIEAGWRSVRIEVAEFDDVDSAKIDISGPYAALNYHF